MIYNTGMDREQFRQTVAQACETSNLRRLCSVVVAAVNEREREDCVRMCEDTLVETGIGGLDGGLLMPRRFVL
jgi:hypothetical protein